MTMHDPKQSDNIPHLEQQRVADLATTREHASRARRLGDTLGRMGRLKPAAIDRIVEQQKRTSGQFGAVARQLGLLTQDDVNTALALQHGFLRNDLGAVTVPEGLVVVRRPASPQAEEFRLMRTRLLTTRKQKQLQLFSMVSCGTTRHADYAAINLAASFAQLQKRTLLIDSDLRGKRTQKIFALPEGPGLCDVLSGKNSFAEAHSETVVRNLSVLTSGGPAHCPQELLAGDKFKRFLREIKTQFDHVIVLSSPFGKIADGQFAWTGAKSVFVVVRRDHDRLKELKQLTIILRQLRTDIIGAALIK